MGTAADPAQSQIQGQLIIMRMPDAIPLSTYLEHHRAHRPGHHQQADPARHLATSGAHRQRGRGKGTLGQHRGGDQIGNENSSHAA